VTALVRGTTRSLRDEAITLVGLPGSVVMLCSAAENTAERGRKKVWGCRFESAKFKAGQVPRKCKWNANLAQPEATKVWVGHVV